MLGLLAATPCGFAVAPRTPLMQSRAAAPRMSVDIASAFLTAGPGFDHLSSMYLNSLHEHYYATTAVQALTLVATGDVLAQTFEINSAKPPGAPAQAYDPLRTARMGALGMLIGGLGTARWLQFLEMLLPLRESEAGVWSAFEAIPSWMYAPILRLADETNLDQTVVGDAYFVLLKATLDACFWAPLANTAYLVLTPLVEGESVESVKGILRERFVPVMKTELMTFFPYNLISFSLVPPLVRPFTTGFVSMCFAVFISWITHLHPEEEEALPEPLIETGETLPMPAITMPSGREVTLVSDTTELSSEATPYLTQRNLTALRSR